MTYKELANKIVLEFTREQQEMDVTIHDKNDDEFFAINKLKITKHTDVLDKGHPYLILKK